jgi:hypothetical protein
VAHPTDKKSALRGKIFSPTSAAMASMMDKTDKRYLPKKELDLYKSIAKHYETKQYKKGTKVQPPRPTLEPITAITAPTLLRSCISNRKGERERKRGRFEKRAPSQIQSQR